MFCIGILNVLSVFFLMFLLQFSLVVLLLFKVLCSNTLNTTQIPNILKPRKHMFACFDYFVYSGPFLGFKGARFFKFCLLYCSFFECAHACFQGFIHMFNVFIVFFFKVCF